MSGKIVIMYSLQISMYEKIRKVSALNIAVAHVCKKIWNPQILRIYSFMLVRRMTWRKSKLASPWVWTSTGLLLMKNGQD